MSTVLLGLISPPPFSLYHWISDGSDRFSGGVASHVRVKVLYGTTRGRN